MNYVAVVVFALLLVHHSVAKDPEEDMDAPQIIRRWNYPVEEHRATTKDGYILKMYRIPHGRNLNGSASLSPKPVVFFQHGLLSSCVDWISNLPSQSGPFVFADRGFDVWLGNFRGNTYGREHVRLRPTDSAFWQFTWDQMAKYDLPAQIDVALNISRAKNLYYVGHSEGTMTVFAKLSTDGEFASKISHVFALGPVSTLGHIEGAFYFLARLTPEIELMIHYFGENEFLPQNKFVDVLIAFFCRQYVVSSLCKNFLFLIAGPDSHQLNVSRIPVYLSHTPAGTSTRNMIHFGQMILSGKFQMYDYGSVLQNFLHYGKASPPLYDLTKITVPVTLFWGANDWLADPKDIIQNLIPNLKTLFASHFLENFNHLDFLWGMNVTDEIYNVIVAEISASRSADSV